jgi:hypothetical protein
VNRLDAYFATSRHHRDRAHYKSETPPAAKSTGGSTMRPFLLLAGFGALVLIVLIHALKVLGL